jgi:hypothetical protein
MVAALALAGQRVAMMSCGLTHTAVVTEDRRAAVDMGFQWGGVSC